MVAIAMPLTAQDPSIASILAEASVSASTYTKVRLTVEMRTSISTDYAWYLWNYDTSAYVQVKAGSLGTSDTTLTHTETSTGSSPYVSSTGQIKSLLDWRDLGSNAFDVLVDKIEFGVR